MSILEGVHTLDEMGELLPKMSLVHQGLLGKPMAPMLVIAGVLDTQVPIDDNIAAQQRRRSQRCLDQSPRRTSGPPSRSLARSLIFKQVIIPWLVKTLEASGEIARDSCT